MALRYNTSNQSKTVSDLLADEILYNLALYNDYYNSNRVNGIPSFVTLSSGMAAVQQNLGGSVSIAVAPTGDTGTPGMTASHQTTDNWGFTPVVDPGQINRLFCIYRAEFRLISTNDLAVIFPPSQPLLDSTGRPALDYHPIMIMLLMFG